MAKLTPERITTALDSWINLNEVLMTSTEEQAQQLLAAERKDRKRPAFLKRIHSRLNKLRAQREREELSK